MTCTLGQRDTCLGHPNIFPFGHMQWEGSKLLCRPGFNYMLIWMQEILLYFILVLWQNSLLFHIAQAYFSNYYTSVARLHSDRAVLQELLSPFIQVGKIIYSLSKWEDPLKSLLFLAFMLYVIQR
jgi:hypothetical protein